MSVGFLDTALTGLATFQRSLETTSHNIANVNTEGYTRQRAELGTMPSEYTGAGFIGNGVKLSNITRAYNEFVTVQLRSSTSSFSEVDKYYQMAAEVDQLVADSNTGMSSVINAFFNSVNDVADEPSSLAARQMMLSEADNLSQQFNFVNNNLAKIRHQLNNDLKLMAKKANDIAENLAELNVKIVDDWGKTSTEQQPNDLLDERDRLLLKLSEIVDIATVEQPNGSVDVFVGKGQPLVVSAVASSLNLQNSELDASLKEIHLGGQSIDGQLTGGEIVGALRFRDEILDPAQRELGLTAAGVAIEFNRIHQTGFDLNGNAGGPLFDLGSPEITVVALTSAAGGSVSASFDTTATDLDASDYQLDVTGIGPTTFTLTRLSDNTVVPVADTGFSVSFSGTMAVGDQFVIRPTWNTAKSMTSLISDPKRVAASQSAATVPGDNRVALQLAGLETQSTMLGGTTSFSESYSLLIASIGSQTSSAKVNRTAQESLFKQSEQAWDEISGVNLDEEAANLIKFQNSYQAAAQAASVANQLFDALLSTMR